MKKGKTLAIKIIVYILAAAVIGIVLGVIGWLVSVLPVVSAIVGTVLGVIGWVVRVYCLIGIILAILNYLKVIK